MSVHLRPLLFLSFKSKGDPVMSVLLLFVHPVGLLVLVCDIIL